MARDHSRIQRMNRAVHAAASTALLAVAAVAPLSAQNGQNGQNGQTVAASRVDVAPVLDGILDEPIWRAAEAIDAFVQQEPDEGAPASERTEARILYDGENLYIGVRAFDSEPDAVIATEMRRDSDRILEEDNFQIILDTFKDFRSAYMFVTTPLGAKLEQQVFEEGEGGRRRGFGVATNINKDWDGVWHVGARRTDDGWAAEIAIPMVTLRFPDEERQEWGINFMRNIRRKNEQAFWAGIPKPYTLTRVSLAGSLTGLESLNRGMDLRVKPFVSGGAARISDAGVVENDGQREVGFDIKYGVSAGLNLDLTYNTDFAQAEVDDEQVNLTRFALFYPEKREFFLENAGQFNVGTNSAFMRVADLFFSRRIGLSRTGDPIPILGGARLTGKVGRNNIAIMDIQTDGLPGDVGQGIGGRDGENFFVARYSRDIMARSKVGALVINKHVGDGHYINRTFAADMTLAPHPAFLVNSFIAKTSTTGITDGQLAGYIRLGWLDEDWNVYGEYADFQDNFNPEVGFLPRNGIRISKIHLERNPRPGRFGVRVFDPMVNITYTTDQNNRLVTRRIHHMLGTRLQNGAYINIWYNANLEVLDQPFHVRPDVVVEPGTHRFGDWRFSFNSDPSRRLYGTVYYSPQTFFDGDRTDYSASAGFRLTSQLAAEGAFTRNDVRLPGGDFSADIASFRVDYALSPTMTLRTVTQYNSLTDQWSTAARFNYIYRPGSDIYIVYDELRRNDYDEFGRYNEFASFRERQLIVKVTYLFSR
ncbi:MAG: hypothetical protein F4X47_10850 [Gammaproteobacteria bacterium]|nr:hypothetical protein [Gammaproteobacteria bacterium]MYC52802.1 hypothetical protein [Gammaproteobacteria bacterium]